MTNTFVSDEDLLEHIHSGAIQEDNPAYIQLSNDSSVRDRIEPLFALPENRESQYVRFWAFQSLVGKVKKGDVRRKSLINIYADYVTNLLEAEPIRRCVEPQMSQILERLYKNKTLWAVVENWVDKSVIPQTEDDVINDALYRMVENIQMNKFKGESKLAGYFRGCCWNIFSEFRTAELKKLDGDTYKRYDDIAQIPQSDGFKDPKDSGFEDPLEYLGEDFTIGVEENEEEFAAAERQLNLSEKCKEAFVMKYKQDLDLADIAVRLGIKYQSAKNILQECRDKLKIVPTRFPHLKDLARNSSLLKKFFK